MATGQQDVVRTGDLPPVDGPDPRGPRPGSGPFDAEDLDPEATQAMGLVDFGAVHVPVPADGTVEVERKDGRLQAVHIALPEGRLSVSALAAPKSSDLWPELAKEIAVSLRAGGARVRSYTGQWGRELHATTDASTSVFVGSDGPRWMLYGVATGPTRHAVALDARLRVVVRGTVVVRGRSPFPVRTVLPLEVPEHLADLDADAAPDSASATSAETARLPAPTAGSAVPARRPPDVTPDPVRRVAGPDDSTGPGPVDVGPPAGPAPSRRWVTYLREDGESPPTEILPTIAVPTEDTEAWATSPSPPGRRRLREPVLPVEAEAVRAVKSISAVDPVPLESPTGRHGRVHEPDGRAESRPGRRRAPEPVDEVSAGRRRAPETAPVGELPTGRRRAPDPLTPRAEPGGGRRRAPEPAAPVVEPRAGRRRAPEPEPEPSTEPIVAVPPVVAPPVRAGRHAADRGGSAAGGTGAVERTGRHHGRTD